MLAHSRGPAPSRPYSFIVPLALMLMLVAACGGGTDSNGSPVANAGPDQNVNGGAEVNITGGLSSDPDDDNLIFTWQQVAGSSVTPTPPWDFDNITVIFSAPTSPPGDQTLTFALTVSDDNGAEDLDTVNVVVHNPLPPTDPCQDPNAKKVNVTFAVTFPTGNPARYVGFESFSCGTLYGSGPQYYNGGETTYTVTLPWPVNTPNSSADHFIRPYWWDTGWIDPTLASSYLTGADFTLNGVTITRTTTSMPPLDGPNCVQPWPTCQPAPYWKFTVDSAGVVHP